MEFLDSIIWESFIDLLSEPDKLYLEELLDDFIQELLFFKNSFLSSSSISTHEE